uniref:GH16 domain-containing protein n=1 Tax=uncultured organism TaxID=155900 RepID=M1PQP0_9ZZZZ|nr:hypothetical protein FLSS-27_0024 [uncultured organism]
MIGMGFNNRSIQLVIIILILFGFVVLSGVPAKGRTIKFSGYHWAVKNYTEHKRGPGPNYWSDSEDNVWLDKEENLHLKITERAGNWYSAEVYLKRFLGYGEYIFYLDPQKTELPDEVVLGLFLYGGPGEEVDIEISGWDENDEPNLQFVVQPAHIAGHLDKLKLNTMHEKRTFKIDWNEDRVIFTLIEGHHREPKDQDSVITEWIFTGYQVPDGKLYSRMNLWIFQGDPPEKREPAEITVEGFEFFKDS